MKRKTRILLIIGVLLLVAITLFILFSPIRFVKKVEGSIPYNESNLYMPYGDSLFEISDDGMITQYSISYRDGKERFIQETGSFSVELPVKKYISSDLFITEDDDIMFGDIKETEHKKIGTVKNATDMSFKRDRKGSLASVAVVTSDGLLFVQGDNSTGALGIEAKQINGEFVQVPYLQNVAKAICGINCILVLNTDGEVYLSGTLGDISYQTFTKLETPEKVKDIEASNTSETLIALSVNGNVYEMGISYFSKSYYDELFSSPYTAFYSTFHKITRLKNIESITTPGLDAYAVDNTGKVFCWGSQTKNKSGELRKIFKRIYGLPKYDKIWYNNYLYVLSGDEIALYSW